MGTSGPTGGLRPSEALPVHPGATGHTRPRLDRRLASFEVSLGAAGGRQADTTGRRDTRFRRAGAIYAHQEDAERRRRPPCGRSSPIREPKHRILTGYLDAWLPIMGTTQGRVVVVDGFAGPGRYEGGEPGSPLLMLNALLEHKAASTITAEVVYLFIEARPASATATSRLRSPPAPPPDSVKVQSRARRVPRGHGGDP